MKHRKDWKYSVGLVIIVLLALIFLFLKVPVYNQARSYISMFFYSKYEMRNSLPAERHFSLTIPGGSSTKEKDWYPFVMVFNDNQGFSEYMGKDLSLTIFYNFGAFNWNSGSSDLFLDDSPYFGSFYGGYAVKDNSGEKYGFTEQNEPDLAEIFKVSEYDYKHLVIESLGCPQEKLTMEILSSKAEKNIRYAGYEGWVRIDSLLLVNSPAHKFKGDRRAYIQYGNPLKKENAEDFPRIATHGRIYARYFNEFDSSVFLFILSPNETVVDQCDQAILSKTVITKE